MNDLFATWHHSNAGVVEHLLQARRQLAGEPALESAWVMVDTAITQVSLWLEQQGGAAPATPSAGRAHVERLFQPGAQRRFGGGAGLAGDHLASIHEFLERIRREFPYEIEGGIELLVQRVLQALRHHVTEGEWDDIRSSLPQDLAALL